MQKFEDKLIELLKRLPKFVDEKTGNIIRNEVVNSALKIDKELISLLITDKEVKEVFFSEIKGYWVFETNKFIDYIQNKEFLNDTYTKFKNKIGLTIDNKFMGERGEVALSFPFKDCILEGGMTKDDEQRNEIFFNEILAQDQIDRLLDPKVLTNFRRYSAKGEGGGRATEFKRDKEGTIRDNLIIKGNNLLALYSLKEQFQGKVKLIYIDPPYNIGNDFNYNDNFNRSTWLTFMKNRLEIVKELLKEDGAIFVQIDHHELGYLNILMDEIFKPENKIQIISIKVAAPSGFKAFNPGPIDVTEFILVYAKNKKSFNFKANYVPVDYNGNYNLFLEKKDNEVKNWKFIPIKDKVLEVNGFKNEKEAKAKLGDNYKYFIRALISDFAFNNAENVVSIRDLHNPTETVKKLQEESRDGRIRIYKKGDGSEMYLYKGGAIAFYSSKIKELDGKKQVTELLSNFWAHISWAGIAREGEVKLKNGKKPEALIKQIIDMSTEKGDIVLDYHLGSGTTCAVAHKMGRQYIGIEQLDYGENDSVIRLKTVINGDPSGISREVDWKGGGEFIYCELMRFNQEAIEKINNTKDTGSLLKTWNELCEEYFLDYNLEIKRFNDNVEEFKNLSISEQKQILIEMLNKNQLYVNLSEIDDSEFKVSKEDKELNKKFYSD